MNKLIVRSLRAGIRPLLRFPATRERIWPVVRLLREHFGRSPDPIEIETVFTDGIRARLLLSNHIESQLFWQGFQEADRPAVEWLKSLLEPDHVVLDIGANIGSVTLVAARCVPAGAVHAFEPSGYHLERLRRNLELNGFDNVVVNAFGLSDSAGKATLHLPGAGSGLQNTGGASIFPTREQDGPGRSETIELRRLDDYVLDAGIERLDLIKIDIEGAELQMLQGGRESIARFRPMVIIELSLESIEQGGHTLEEFLAYWHSLEYDLRLIASESDAPLITGRDGLRPHQNALCIPRERPWPGTEGAQART